MSFIAKRPLGMTQQRKGTAYEGYVKVPKLGGVKKGWLEPVRVVLANFKLFLYDISPMFNALPSVHVAHVLDMRDPHLRLLSSLMEPPGPRNSTLMLADSEAEKNNGSWLYPNWHRIFKEE
ncbi:hypothetical protein FQR65_LT19316 [Abscondita terminalis]|nr:hypothetical protein FQR65_LT19316 [Abscondita terminalis]